MTDEELVALCQSGDKAAWEQLYSRYKPKVRAIAHRFFLNGGEAEDLVQEGMFGLISAVNGYKKDVFAFSAYAHHCIRNKIVDAVKKSSGAKHSALNNFLPIVEMSEEQFAPTPEDELIRREDKRELLKKMSRLLSSLEFKAIVLYVDGLTIAEIASELGKDYKSIDNAIHRAKHKLIKKITED